VNTDIYDAIPQREPFLFVDEIVELTGNSIRTRRTLRQDEPFFKGHMPGNPIMPGVLICEAVAQSGAIFLKKALPDQKAGIPALTRLQNAKFKRFLRPGDTMEMTVELVETIGGAYFMKGTVRVAGKRVASVEFSCTLVEP